MQHDTNRRAPFGDAGASSVETGPDHHDGQAGVMDLLAEHVPLALLADLAEPGGPVSREILEDEGLPDDAWWEKSEPDSTPHEASTPRRAAGGE